MARHLLTDQQKQQIIDARKAGISIEKILNIFGTSNEIRKLATSVKVTRKQTVDRYNKEEAEVILEGLQAIIDNQPKATEIIYNHREDGYLRTAPIVIELVKKYLKMGIKIIDIANAIPVSPEHVSDIYQKINPRKKVKSNYEKNTIIQLMVNEINQKAYTHVILNAWTDPTITPYVKQWPNGLKVFVSRKNVSVPYIHALHKDYEVK